MSVGLTHTLQQFRQDLMVTFLARLVNPVSCAYPEQGCGHGESSSGGCFPLFFQAGHGT